MSDAARLQQKKTYLDLVAIFHYIYGAVAAVFILGALVVMAMAGSLARFDSDLHEPWACLPFAIAGFFLVLGLVYVALNLLAGWWLHRRRAYLGCMVVSGLNCFNMPLGTILGVATIVLLADNEVRAMFEGAAPAGSPPAPPVGAE